MLRRELKKNARVRVRAAAATINLERELASLMTYYPAIERVLSRFAEIVPDVSQLATIIRAGMDRVTAHRRLVPVYEDCKRLKAFLDCFLEAAAASAIYVVRCCQEGFRFSLSPPEPCCVEGEWAALGHEEDIEQKRTKLLAIIGLDRLE